MRDFKPLELRPYLKDGGVFVRFSYVFAPPTSDPNFAVEENERLRIIERELQEEVARHGPLPSWLGSFGLSLRPSTLWLVKGVPWLEVNPPIYVKHFMSLRPNEKGHESVSVSNRQTCL